MPFVSDEQRKAAFARMKGRNGGGGGQKPPRTPGGRGGSDSLPGDPIMDAIGAWLTAGHQFTPKPNGSGIQGSDGGPVELTGGAIYQTAASDWFLSDDSHTPTWGPLTGAGVQFDTDITLQQFQAAQTLWGSLWYEAHGIDPNTGDMIPPQGTPGTLKSPLQLVLAQEADDRNAGSYAAFVGGTGNLPSGYSGVSNVYNLPAFLQWIEENTQ